MSRLLKRLNLRKEEVRKMTNVIKVTPNKDGKIFITLYGTKYEIVIEEPKTEKVTTTTKK